MILAGDIGGTKTRLGLFDTRTERPTAVVTRSFPTLDYPGLPEMIADFVRNPQVHDADLTAACFGVAGPVMDDEAQLTNVPWRVSARAVERSLALRRAALLNDLQAMARVWREGQTKRVWIYRLLTAESVHAHHHRDNAGRGDLGDQREADGGEVKLANGEDEGAEQGPEH